MADPRTCEVEVTSAPLNLQYWNDIWPQTFGKCATSGKGSFLWDMRQQHGRAWSL